MRVGVGLAATGGILPLTAVIRIAQCLVGHEYRPPVRVAAGAADATPREQGLADEKAADEKTAMAKPYVEPEYRAFPVVGSRVAVWVAAQLHLLFAAFVLAVPLFAFIIEAIGYNTGEKKYDRLAYEFTKLLSVSFSMTATFGAGLTFLLIILYPKFTTYLMGVFSPTFLPYVGLFFFEAFFLYTYYYGWGKFHPLVHLGLGFMLNVVGTGIMMIANAWLTFMTSPAGISEKGAVLSVWDAVHNYTWMPINVHRFIANIAFGGCFMVWATPRSIIATVAEVRAMGGSAHPILGYLGVMSAKNTAVNILILTTFMSFLLYRRTGRIATVAWAKTGNAVQLAIFALAAITVITLGVYGYFVEARVRLGLSVPHVASVLFALVWITLIAVFLFRGAKTTREVRWG